MGNHLQEMEETEEAGRGTAKVLGNPKKDGKPAGMEVNGKKNEKQCEEHGQPRQPLCQNREKRDFRPFPQIITYSANRHARFQGVKNIIHKTNVNFGKLME